MRNGNNQPGFFFYQVEFKAQIDRIAAARFNDSKRQVTGN
jgi:hypothetical protein